MFRTKVKLDYATNKPDHSIIDVMRGTEQIGTIIWVIEVHKFMFETLIPVYSEELRDIMESLDRLNKAAIPPKGIEWK